MKTAISLGIALATLALSASAQAESFTCNFTEPFFTITYSTSTKKIIRDDYENVSTIRNVSFVISGENKFELRDSQDKTIAELTLNREGSDGMSDVVYPYAIHMLDRDMDANKGWGGCESSLLKKVIPQK